MALLQRNTIVVLILLLIAFVVGIELAQPGTVNAIWLSNTLLFAAPLGILAAGQTLVMLTGGIDLSVASVATGSAYLLATNASLGSVVAVLLGLSARPRRRPRQRRRHRGAWRAAAGDDARHRADDRAA